MCGRCTRKGAGTSSPPATAFVSNMKINLGKSEFKTRCDSGQSPSNATEFFFYTAFKKIYTWKLLRHLCPMDKGWQIVKDSI